MILAVRRNCWEALTAGSATNSQEGYRVRIFSTVGFVSPGKDLRRNAVASSSDIIVGEVNSVPSSLFQPIKMGILEN